MLNPLQTLDGTNTERSIESLALPLRLFRIQAVSPLSQ